MKICIAGKTDIGLERANNEDAFIFCPDLTSPNWNASTRNEYIKNGEFGAIFVVADGMGGASAGAMASSIVMESLKRELTPNVLSDIVTTSFEGIKDFLKRIIQKANEAILNHVESDPDTIGMGTTIVLVWLLNNKAYIAWCGDSRCYVFNPKNGLKTLTKDHSYVQELIDRGEITISQSFDHPDSNIITRCLGDCDAFPEPEIVAYDINKHDQFMLCSDGLCGYCRDRNIEKVFYNECLSVSNCCDALVELALKAGGQDNITVLNISVIDDTELGMQFSIRDKIVKFFKIMF